MQQAFIYSLKIWLTTIIVAPLLTYLLIYVAFLLLWNDNIGLIFGPSPLSPAGIIASSLRVTPAVLIILAVLYFGSKTPFEIKVLKLIVTALLIATAIGLSISHSIKSQLSTMNPFVLVYDSTVTAYILILIVSIWFYKLNPIRKEVNTVNL